MSERNEPQKEVFDFSETKKVFDTSRYKKYPLNKRKRIIANDLAGLVLEAGDRNLSERTNPWYIAITPDNKIINLLTREEVTVNFGNNTELSRNETAGTIDFYYNKAAEAKVGDLIFWISPSGGNSPYKESRINVAKIRNLYGMKVLECYGIPSKLSPRETLKLANKLLVRSGQKPVFNPDDLRKTSIRCLNIENLPLDSNAWEEILKGTPRKIKRKAYRTAMPIATEMSEALEFASSEREFVDIGARGEIYMMQRGWKIDVYQCMGSLNSELIETQISGGIVIDTFGNFRKVDSKEDWTWTTGDCIIPAPECGRKNVKVGPCKVCEICQEKFDNEEMARAA